MIYRLLVEYCLDTEVVQSNGRGPLTGPWNNIHLSYLMDLFGLPVPDIKNVRARFYFTEKGWRQVGRLLASEARMQGHPVKVIRRKNPRKSQVVYVDELQVAILPHKATGH